MISKKMEKALNGQINNELYSAYLYLAMAAEAAGMGLNGAAQWLTVQWREETGHAMKFFNYLLEQGNTPELLPIAKPKTGFDSLLAMFEAVLKHEQFITGCIRELMSQAVAEKDYASQILLQWYVNEQVEEEKNATEILGMLKLAGSSGGALLMIDRQLGKREFKAE